MTMGRKSGFSLLEIAIVVSIIGILAALAIPLFRHIALRSRISAVANDLRIHGGALHRYAMEEGTYPPSMGSGSIPPELKGYLTTAWTLPSPVGGVYSWRADDPSATSPDAYIQITPTGEHPFAITYDDLLELDKVIDDGSPGSGVLQISGTRVRYYVSQAID